MESPTPPDGPGRLGPLRWLARRLSGLARWVAGRLRGPLRPIARQLVLRLVGERLPAPLRRLGALLFPAGERGFGYWWLVVTLGIALAVGLLVAVLVSPVAGLIALLVVAIWALVRRSRHTPERLEPAPAQAQA